MVRGASVSFQRPTSAEAETILGWPDRFAATLKPRLPAMGGGRDLPPAEAMELREHGLLDAGLRPTPLAETLIDLLAREDWQDRDEFAALAGGSIGNGSGLEVGCSTGRRLRTLGHPASGGRVGIDVDATAIALGYRLARAESQPVEFSCSSAHALEFQDATFDWVICRNALTYMHQRLALEEMARVLRPGGTLYLRFENVLFDLNGLRHPRGIKRLATASRNLIAGFALAATGMQINPDRLRNGRAFASRRNVLRTLRRAGCELVASEESGNCPRFLGRSTQTSLVLRKAGGSSHLADRSESREMRPQSAPLPM